MLHRGVPLDRRTLPRVLDASCLMGDFIIGQQFHAHALKLGFSSDQYDVISLIEMYGHLSSFDLAQTIFDKSPHKNLVCWTLLARLYVVGGKPSLALDLLHQMVEQGVVVDPVALATACSACGMMKSLQHGRDVHEIARKFGLEFNVLVCNSLLKMYIDCYSIRDARLVFEQMPCGSFGFNSVFSLLGTMVGCGVDGTSPL